MSRKEFLSGEMGPSRLDLREQAQRLYQIKNVEAASKMQDRRRKLIHEAFQNHLRQRRIKELCEVSQHASALARLSTIGIQDSAAEVSVSEKVDRERLSAVEMDRLNFEDEVRHFENKGYELGADTAADLTSVSENLGKSKDKHKDVNKSSKDAKPSKKAKLDETLESIQDGNNALLAIKERVSRAEKEKFEMEQKQRADEFNAKQREKEIEELSRKHEEYERMMKCQVDEAQRAAELQAAENLEKDKLAVRLELEQLIAEQRNREWEAVLARDREVLTMMKHDRDDELNIEQHLWQEERQRKLDQKQRKHNNFCREILLQILNLAERSAAFKLSTNCNLSSIEWWEWKNLFVKGSIQPVDLNSQPLESEKELFEDDEMAEKVAVMDYIKNEGEWKFDQPINSNKELGDIIYHLFNEEDSDTDFEPPPYLSCMELKLAVLSSPFAGKTFASKQLENKFGIVHLEMENIIASAIAQASREEENMQNPDKNYGQETSDVDTLEEPSSRDGNEVQPAKVSTILPKVALGRQAQEAISNGLQVPDEVAVQLLLHTLKSLDSDETETLSVSPKGVKKKKDLSATETASKLKGNSKTSTQTSAAHKGVKEKGGSSKGAQIMEKMYSGFILDGFPSTRQQAELLYRGLNGLGLTLNSTKTQFTSLLAPPPYSDLAINKCSYPLDALFVLDPLKETDALKVALGKYVDPKTGSFYHLEFDPPPENDRTGIVSRLKAIEDVNVAVQRIKEGMETWNGLFEWISEFSNVHLVHHDEKMRLNLDEAYSIVQGILDTKNKITAASDAAKAAIEAEESASRAACEAEKASSQMNEIAHKLFLAKLAEIEALTVLERTNNDPVAKDILKKKVSESTSRYLQEATKAVKEADSMAEASRKASEDALQARNVAEEAVSSLSIVMQAREQALAAAESAKLSATKAASAYQRAQTAANNAALNLGEITSSLGNTEKSFFKQKISELSVQSSQNKIDIPPVIDSIACPSEPKQDESGLRKLWQATEGAYMNKLSGFFRKLRLERENAKKSLMEIKGNLMTFLKRQDQRQTCLDDFQGKYNRIECSQRLAPKMKKQLQKAADDFFKKLHVITEGFLKEAQVNHQKSLNRWIQERTDAVSESFTMLVNIELERFLGTCCLLYEHFRKRSSSHIRDKFMDGNGLRSLSTKQTKSLPSLPGWLSSIGTACPSLQQILEQAIVSSNAIAKAIIEPENSNSNQLDSGHKTRGKGQKGMNDSNEKKETILDAGSEKLTKVAQDEIQLLLLRLERLASKACRQLWSSEELLEGSRAQLSILVEHSRKVKNEATDEVIAIVQEAIEEGIPLWYYMCLDGEHLAIDETKLQMDPPNPLGLQTLPDLTNFHYQLLEELVRTFQEGFDKGYVSLSQALERVEQAIEVVHTICKNDCKFSMIPRVPGSKSRPGGPFQVWKDYTDEIIKTSSKSLDQIIDWRFFLVSLMDMHFHNFISTASVDDILNAHIALKGADQECSTSIQLSQFLSTELWFDTDNGYISGQHLKQIMFKMFSSNNALPWQTLLIYLCKDPDIELALKKAYAAIKGNLSGDFVLTAKDLLKVLYPYGESGALDQGFHIWSSQHIQNLLQSKTNEAAEQSASGGDELENSASGSSKLYARSIDACRGSKPSDQSFISSEMIAGVLNKGQSNAGNTEAQISKDGCIKTRISKVDDREIRISEIGQVQREGNSSVEEKSNTLSVTEKEVFKSETSGKRENNIVDSEMRISRKEEMRASKMDANDMMLTELGQICDIADIKFEEEQADEEGKSASDQFEVCSLFSEQAVAVMNEFLIACRKALSPSLSDNVSDTTHISIPESETAFSVAELLASELLSTLKARFGSNMLLVMQPSSALSSSGT
ncbi:hypothetical protein KP509_24G001900 [Ceratopteris richardii]|uniref:Uncharacterized protein n=1 Tax=Ceratopteris richardii TaxID=49495 RepID=A0A8T2RTM3_CERRI|nr:hypothetical protein KP509_24G001900 [Ceratopteris richardii]